MQATTIASTGQPGQHGCGRSGDIDGRAGADVQHAMVGESHGRRIGAAVHQGSHHRQLGGDEVGRPVVRLVASGEVHVMVFQFPAQAGEDTADWLAAPVQQDRRSVPQLAWMLLNRGQAFLDGTIQVGADNPRRSVRTSVDGVGAGLFGRVLLADAASLGSPQQAGTGVGGLRDMGEYVRPRPARQRRRFVQVVVGQRLCGGREAGRTVGYPSPLGRICCRHV